jgi:hypothetical protein
MTNLTTCRPNSRAENVLDPDDAGGEASARGFSVRMQGWIVLDHPKRCRQCQAPVNGPPLTGVPHPVDVEPILPHVVKTSEGCVKFRSSIVFMPER